MKELDNGDGDISVLLMNRSVVPSDILAIMAIIHFVMALLIHGRQVEWTARLDFLWNLQANEEKSDMTELQNSNKRILYNLLPAHVARHFLDNQLRSNMVCSLSDSPLNASLACITIDIPFLEFLACFYTK